MERVFTLRNRSPVCSLQANRRRSSISMQGLVGRHRCVISVMTRLERAEPCRGRLCSPLVSSERPGQQMCFLKECLRLVCRCPKTKVHLLPWGRVVGCLPSAFQFLCCYFTISTIAHLLFFLLSFPKKFIFSTKHPFHSFSQTITSSLPLGVCPARPQPTSRPTVPQKDVQARQVLLSWEPGSDGLSPVRYYTVQLRELPDSNWTVHSASVSHEATNYIVSR